LKFGKRKQKREVFLKTDRFFGLSIGFKLGFIQNSIFEWKTLNQPVFSVYRSIFPIFGFFQNFSKIKILNYNRPIFGESKKPDETCFIGFCDNRAVFIDI
jgi:hypothetical protein